MKVIVEHGINQAEAVPIIDSFLDELVNQGLPGIGIEDPERSWNGNQMWFSFHARKGFFGTGIEGTITVTDKHVVLESDLPGMVTSFVSEKDVENTIKEKIEELF